MSIFGKIRDAIFGRKDAGAGNRPQAPTGRGGVNPAGTAAAPSAPAAPVAPAPVQDVDVEQVLTRIQQEKGNPELNWRTSIVDLMKLLGIDSSLDNRKELATELGYTGATDGSAEMNIWLHKAVMKELARNGGKVPSNLTD
jgi:3-oxoacyl-ACP reductase-like protein